jgi:hypothetical protein
VFEAIKTGAVTNKLLLPDVDSIVIMNMFIQD